MDFNDFFAAFLAAQGKRQDNSMDESKYKEIRKLDEMLKNEDIPHLFQTHPMGGYQLVYYGHKGQPQPEPGVLKGAGVGAVCSVIETPFSYGHADDLLEISGLVTQQEKEELQNTVKGSLTAEDVFARIKIHWTENE